MFVSHGSLVERRTPLSISNLTSSWFPYVPGMSTGGYPSAYGGMFTAQLWVYVVVMKRARATARLPLPVYRREDKNRPRDDSHPMSLLLENPSPGLSPHRLWLWVSATFDIWGDAFLYKKRDKNAPAGMWLFPLHPSAMTRDERTSTWTFDNGRMRLEEIPDSDLVRFLDFHPTSMSTGLSPLEPLRSTLENEWNARNATSSFWQRGARPGTYLIHEKNLSQPAMDRLKAQYDQLTSGSGNTGATLILEEGMQPKHMTLTAEEAQYIETRKLNREEVCAAYDVPPPVVHILDRATFSNITEQMRSMYRDTMGPHLAGFEAAIETDLRRAEWPNDNVYAEFLMDEVLRGDFEQRQDALAKASHMTIAEKRRVENLPEIPGTDRIFLNAGIMPLDAIDAQAQALVAADAAAGDAVIPLAVARSLIGRLSWQRSLSEVDPDVLLKGFETYAPAVLEAAQSATDVRSFRESILAMVEES